MIGDANILQLWLCLKNCQLMSERFHSRTLSPLKTCQTAARFFIAYHLSGYRLMMLFQLLELKSHDSHSISFVNK
jgi:hypothetical protein